MFFGIVAAFSLGIILLKEVNGGGGINQNTFLEIKTIISNKLNFTNYNTTE